MYSSQQSRNPTRYYGWPNDKRINDAPKDGISCVKFAPVAPPLAGGHDVLAVSSWDGLVRIYQVTKPQLLGPETPSKVSNYIAKPTEQQAQAAHNEYNYPQAQKVLEYKHDGQPILDLSWMPDGTKVVSGGCDGSVKMFDLQTSQAMEVYKHNAPVKCVHVFQCQGETVIVSAAWDKTIHFVFSSGGTALHVLEQRPVSIDSNPSFMAIAMSERRMLCIYTNNKNNFINLDQSKVTDSPLRWQTRTVKCFPKRLGMAIGTIEGRVAVNYPWPDAIPPDPSTPATRDPSYTFKCHRTHLNTEIYNPSGINRAGAKRDNIPINQEQHVFPVNAIAFHPRTETFVSGGGDGAFTFWDGIRRSKLRTYTAQDIEQGTLISRWEVGMSGGNQKYLEKNIRSHDLNQPLPNVLPIVSMSYNSSGTVMAYARCYDWSKGYAYAPAMDSLGNYVDPSQAPQIMLKLLVENDVTKYDPAPPVL